MTQPIVVFVGGKGLTQEEAENKFMEELRARVKELGLMDENMLKFFSNVFFTFAFLPFILAGSVSMVNGIVSAMFFGCLLGVNYTFFGTLGHDISHGQALRKHPKAQRRLKLTLGPICLGFDHDWWEDKHNNHHFWSHVNEKDRDTNIPLAMSAEQARDRGLTSKSFRVRNAWWIFPCLLPLQALAARRSSYLYIKSADIEEKERRLHLRLMGLHLVLYGILLLAIGIHAGLHSGLLLGILCPPVFALSNQFTHGWCNSWIFATNHKEFDVVSKDAETRWVWRQLYTSHNVASGKGPFERVFTFLFGALNYQIEHHLFQTMPRYNLRKLRPHVRELTAKYGLPYSESNIFKSYWGVFRIWGRVSHDLLTSEMGAA